MKAPSGDLLFYAVILLGGAIYFAVRLPTIAARYQLVTVAFATCLLAEGVLLLARFRWSPEGYAALFVFTLGWAVVRVAMDGFNGNRIGMIAGGVIALYGYPVLRREVRRQATPSDEPDVSH